MKFSGYYIYINLNIQGDFQICISIPLRLDAKQFPFIHIVKSNRAIKPDNEMNAAKSNVFILVIGIPNML